MIEARPLYTTDGVRLNLLHSGPGEAQTGPTVVLIPGWCLPASMWRETMLAMAARHQVVALDPRGQGDSEIPQCGYHIDQRADDLARCIDLFDRAVLVGWSLGALEALQYVHRHGEARIAGLALIDSSVGEEPPPPPSPRFREDLQSDRRGATERFVRSMFRSIRTEGEIANLTHCAMRLPLDASLALLPSQIPREHWRDIARSVRAPLLYAVTGQFAEQGRNLCKARPGTQLEVFEDAGHALFVDEAGRFQRLLQSFIAGAIVPGQRG